MKQLTQSKTSLQVKGKVTNSHHNAILIRQMCQSSCYSQKRLIDTNIKDTKKTLDTCNSTKREKDTKKLPWEVME